MSLKKKIILGLSGIAVLVGVGFLATGIKVIPAGYVGIVYKANGGVAERTLGQGWNWTMPVISKVSLYSVGREQTALSLNSKEGDKTPENFTIMTSDGKGVDIDLEFSYFFEKNSLSNTFKEFKGKEGKKVEEEFIKPKMKTVANNISTQFKVLDIYSEKRPELNKAIKEAAQKYFKPYGIVIEEVSVTQMRLDTATEKAIQEVVDKQQELEKAKLQTKIAEEEGAAELKRAEATAQAKIVAAEGERKANEELSKSITPEILKKMEMEARLKHGWVEINGVNTTVVK